MVSIIELKVYKLDGLILDVHVSKYGFVCMYFLNMLYWNENCHLIRILRIWRFQGFSRFFKLSTYI